MRLSQLRPCDKCGGAVAPLFYVVRVSQAMVDARRANGVLGLGAVLGGIERPGALAIAEALSPDTDKAVTVFGDAAAQLTTEIFLCQECALLGDISLGQLIEARGRASEAAVAAEQRAAEAELLA